MDSAGCGVVLLCAFVSIVGGLVALIVFGAHEHSVPAIAMGGGGLALLAASLAGQMWRDHRDEYPRERREVQKGARWP